MHGYIIDDQKLYICSKSPICSGTKLEEGKFIKPKSGEEELIDCHKCESKMELNLVDSENTSAANQIHTATRQLMKTVH